jgi:acyl-CoA thioesterase
MDLQQYMDFINRKNYFMLHNHMTLLKLEKDQAIGEVTVGQDSLNPLGILHGGAYFTLADCVASAATRSNGLQYVTLNSSIDFFRSAKEGKVRATAMVRHRGRTTCLSAVELRDEQGELLAEGKFTMFCLNVPVNMD